MSVSISLAALLAALALTVTAGCQQGEVPAVSAAPAAIPPVVSATTYMPAAGVQDIMALEVDPSADALWAAVSTEVTRSGEKEHRPENDKQWAALRDRALVLIEATNLLKLDGRQVAREDGKQLDDEGTPGNLSAEQSQKAIEANRNAFVGFATAMGVVGEEMLKAIDAKSPEGLMQAGGALDEVCENCHLTFWYPDQNVPPPRHGVQYGQ